MFMLRNIMAELYHLFLLKTQTVFGLTVKNLFKRVNSFLKELKPAQSNKTCLMDKGI